LLYDKALILIKQKCGTINSPQKCKFVFQRSRRPYQRVPHGHAGSQTPPAGMFQSFLELSRQVAVDLDTDEDFGEKWRGPSS
jgi:hypothetical protein